MQSRMNKAQIAFLVERGFTVQAGNRHAFLMPSPWERRSIVCRRAGWSWHCQDLRTHDITGRGEKLLCPVSAFIHAEVSQWRTT